MRFHLFERPFDAHIRKSREYLEQAHVGRVEHQAAAEHHSALARMYTERIARIEMEISDALRHHSAVTAPAEAVRDDEGRFRADPVLVYPARA